MLLESLHMGIFLSKLRCNSISTVHFSVTWKLSSFLRETSYLSTSKLCTEFTALWKWWVICSSQKKGVLGLQVIRMLQGCFISYVIAWVTAFSCSLSGVYKYFFASVSSAAFLSSFYHYVSKSRFCHSPLVTYFLPLLTG